MHLTSLKRPNVLGFIIIWYLIHSTMDQMTGYIKNICASNVNVNHVWNWRVVQGSYYIMVKQGTRRLYSRVPNNCPGRLWIFKDLPPRSFYLVPGRSLILEFFSLNIFFIKAPGINFTSFIWAQYFWWYYHGLHMFYYIFDLSL